MSNKNNPKRYAYLTIDDSPTPYTDILREALKARNIPALFFVRGDMIDKYSADPLRRLIQDGFVLGNHMMTHTRTSTMDFEIVKREIVTMKSIIDNLYHAEGIRTAPLYFRFPHMDRGTGGHIIDYQAIHAEHRDFVTSLFADGLNVDLASPTIAQIKQKIATQNFLRSLGYKQPFNGVTFPWFQGEMSIAVDCMYSFSTADWMILDRHRGRWKYKSLADLKQKIDNDTALHDTSSHHIILAHDKDELGFNDQVIELVDYMIEHNFEFLSF
jgi:peptidoglycan/xylan/chitin deacetylase (PgdA/CDA1 family)